VRQSCLEKAHQESEEETWWEEGKKEGMTIMKQDSSSSCSKAMEKAKEKSIQEKRK